MKKYTLILILVTILFSCSSEDDSINPPDDNNNLPCGNTTAIVDVTNPITGKTWMDRNLGATQVAASSTDANSYGDLYQWGRRTDGHQCRNSATTTTLSSTDQPALGDFIWAPNPPWDWRNPQNDNLWQGVNGINNPCPSGYRLPTEAEWNEERESWGLAAQNSLGAFASPLKLTVGGHRGTNELSPGTLYGAGSNGTYWSSNTTGGNTRYFSFSPSNVGMSNGYRATARSVRCIKD
jgi:uncharacterized protein (TIGR02145 family)